MAHVIEGNAATFNALAYAPPHPSLAGYLHQQIESFGANIAEAASGFYQKSLDTYNRIHSDLALRLSRAARAQANTIWNNDAIKPLRTVGEVQTADLIMQRWVMAEPTVRKLYQAQRCDGYSESYIDMCEGYIAETHRDYRVATDGNVEFDSNGIMNWTNYCEEEELTIEDKADIKISWAAAEHAILTNQDPTSKWGDTL